MRKKSDFTIAGLAIALVFEFEKVVRKLEQQVALSGQRKGALQNYLRRIALFVVHPLQTATKSTIPNNDPPTPVQFSLKYQQKLPINT